MCGDGDVGGMLWLEGWDCPRLFSPQWVATSLGNTLWSGSRDETKGWGHHLLSTQEATVQLIVHINFYHVSRAASIVLIKQRWRLMQEDKPTTSINRATKKKGNSHLALHFSLVISLTLCSTQPPTPTPSLQHDGQSIARQSALWCCSHLHWAKKKKILRQDMMTYPGGVFHCSLGLLGEGSQPRHLCVHLPTVYDGVFTQGLVPWCCDAECHPAQAWALQPEKPAVKLTGLSSALTYTLSSLADTHTHAATYT